jgi:hypothetical protein
MLKSSRLTVVVLLATVAITPACSDGELRGKSVPSPDGKTYLIVDDDNGGNCGGLRVDGQAWTYKIHSAGPITPGVHTMGCGDSATTAFEVHMGTTFHFDYWGP